MKFLLGLGALIFVGFAGWQLGGRLSSDAIGMALGVLFGVMAGIPAALMVLASRRSEDFDMEEPRRRRRGHDGAPGYGGQGYAPYPQLQQQPPVIVVTGQGAPAGQATGYPQQAGYPGLTPPMQMALPGPTDSGSQRQFRVVGESDDAIDSW